MQGHPHVWQPAQANVTLTLRTKFVWIVKLLALSANLLSIAIVAKLVINFMQMSTIVICNVLIIQFKSVETAKDVHHHV